MHAYQQSQIYAKFVFCFIEPRPSVRERTHNNKQQQKRRAWIGSNGPENGIYIYTLISCACVRTATQMRSTHTPNSNSELEREINFSARSLISFQKRERERNREQQLKKHWHRYIIIYISASIIIIIIIHNVLLPSPTYTASLSIFFSQLTNSHSVYAYLPYYTCSPSLTLLYIHIVFFLSLPSLCTYYFATIR